MKKANNRLFDAAPPISLLALGVPVFIIILVILLIYIAVKLIKHAQNKNNNK